MNAHPLHQPRLDAVTNRLGLRLAGSLDRATRELPHDVTERLRFAREQALARAVRSRRLASAGSVSGQGAAALAGPPSFWWRLASVLPLVLLVAGLALITHQQDEDQIMAAAEIDAILLADELPPSAYSDPGFHAFLRSSQTP